MLKKDKDKAFLSQKLAAIVTQVPLKFDLEKCRLLDYDQNRARAVLRALEFKSLLKKLPGEEGNQEQTSLASIKKQTDLKLKKENNQMELF